MHKNVICLKIGIGIYTEVGNGNAYAKVHRYITFEKRLYTYKTMHKSL